MSDKPKRTISEEQRKKMADGRKKAMEKRKDEKAQKDKQKDIELKQELEVLRAQKDQMEAKAITKENRKKFRDKMRSKSVTFDKEEEPLPVIEEESLALDASPESPREPDESPRDLDSDQKLVRDEKMFKEHVEKLANNANPETKKVFSKITSTYDNNVDITTNLRNMASELKLLIASNVEQIKTNNKVISESKPVREIHQPTFEEIRTEQKYESQLASLMRLR
tara:strand:+ start:1417 stop:2088 length:672 start_codon:yes stop_codon:yes gene_type:complete